MWYVKRCRWAKSSGLAHGLHCPTCMQYRVSHSIVLYSVLTENSPLTASFLYYLFHLLPSKFKLRYTNKSMPISLWVIQISESSKWDRSTQPANLFFFLTRLPNRFINEYTDNTPFVYYKYDIRKLKSLGWQQYRPLLITEAFCNVRLRSASVK